MGPRPQFLSGCHQTQSMKEQTTGFRLTQTVPTEGKGSSRSRILPEEEVAFVQSPPQS